MEIILAHSAYSSQKIRQQLCRTGTTPIIPQRNNQKRQGRFNPWFVPGAESTRAFNQSVEAISADCYPQSNWRLLYQFSKDRLQILQWNEFVQTSVMAGVYKLEMKESEAELKQLLGGQRTATGKQRVQLLYLLKTGQAATVQTAAQL